MKRTIVLFVAAALCSAFIFFNCSSPSSVASGNGSDVGNPELTGHLIDGRDNTMADSAMVRIYPVYLNKMAKALGKVASGAPAIDSTRTDHNGYYRFDSLDQGIYSIEAKMIDGTDTLTMRHPSVVFVATKDLGYDTLRLPGWIKGKVVVPGGESAKNITCYIPGTSYIAITNDTGGFRITGIPAGTYSLSITSARFRDTTLYDFKLTPNHETNAGYIVLGLDRSKNEHDVWGVFDTAYNCKAVDSIIAVVSGDSIPPDKPRIYKLDWRPALNGYSGFIYVPDNGFFWKVDILVFDTLGRRIGAYRLSTINRATGDIEVPNFNPFNSVPLITLHDTTVSINDTIRLKPVIATLPDDSIVSMEWKIGSAGTFAITKKKDTVIVAPKDSGIIPFIFKVTDKFGNTAAYTVIDSVITDPPVFTLGNDTTVNVGSILTFNADVQQRFGSVVMYLWSYQGDTSWTDSGKQHTKSITFNHPGEQRLICKVRDDDGNVAADTVNILVVTEIGGNLPMNAVLRESASPYAVKQDLVVQTGGKLTIEPGTTVKIDPGVNITVYGTIDAEGVNSNRIVFKPNSFDTTAQWGSMNLQPSAVCKLKYCEITSGRLWGSSSNYAIDTLMMDSCTFKNSDINSGQNACGLIRGCTFLGTNVYLVDNNWYFEENNIVSLDQNSPCNLTISHDNSSIPSTISSNHLVGGGCIIAWGGGLILNNTIENSNGNGILATDFFGSWDISNNTLSNCFGIGISVQPIIAGTMGRIRHNNLTGNGFGAAPITPPYQNAGIVCMDAPYSIDSNTITNNNIGVICSSGDTLTNNNIYNNRDYDFRVLVNDAGNVSAPNNWWGTADTAKIRTKIYDYDVDKGLGKVIIDPVAPAEIIGAGPR
jgi:hypothetical protein